jgi:hypothetical protein
MQTHSKADQVIRTPLVALRVDIPVSMLYRCSDQRDVLLRARSKLVSPLFVSTEGGLYSQNSTKDGVAVRESENVRTPERETAYERNGETTQARRQAR